MMAGKRSGTQAVVGQVRSPTSSPDATTQWNITWDASAYGNGPLHLHIPNFQYPDVATFWDAFRNEPGIGHEWRLTLRSYH